MLYNGWNVLSLYLSLSLSLSLSFFPFLSFDTPFTTFYIAHNNCYQVSIPLFLPYRLIQASTRRGRIMQSFAALRRTLQAVILAVLTLRTGKRKKIHKSAATVSMEHIMGNSCYINISEASVYTRKAVWPMWQHGIDGQCLSCINRRFRYIDVTTITHDVFH